MTNAIAYTGPPDAACPITLSFVHELSHPVAFASNPSQPYDLVSLCRWVLISDRHPLNGEKCGLDDIVALQVKVFQCSGDGYDRQVHYTQAMLEGMKLTLHNTKVFFLNSKNHA